MRTKIYKNAAERTAAWSKAHIKTVSVRLNVETDGDVISRIDEEPNKTDYIRELVRRDIRRGAKRS